MQKLFNKQFRIRLLLVGILIIFVISGMLLLFQGQEGIMLFLLTGLVGIVGVVSGLLPALALTLLLFFIIGSLIFWFLFGTSSLESSLTLNYILIWMVKLLILAIMAGRLSMLIKELHEANFELREQINTLVAIDPITGFDNKERMLLELELEYNRSKRYGRTFSFLLIKVNHFEQLRKLYGEQELNRILLHLSTEIYRSVRKSDYKFRPEKDLFGLLLTETSAKDVQRVIDKLNKELSVFQLKNKKYITLEFEYGHVSYGEEIEDYLKVYELAKEQVSFHVS